MKKRISRIVVFFLLALSVAQYSTAQSQTITLTSVALSDGLKGGVRLVITTSMPVEFNSYWLDNPARLVLEFQTQNVVNRIGDEITINEGMIKKIISNYYSDKNRTLKSLTFKLRRKVSYEISQQKNNIILDIQNS